MKFGVKNSKEFSAKVRQLNKFLNEVTVASYKNRVSISGMNPQNTILLELELNKSFLKGYKAQIGKSYIINLNNLSTVFKRLKNQLNNNLMLDFKGKNLTIK